MCWNVTASLTMVATGTVVTLVSARRGDPRAIWVSMGYFTVMEVLQAAGYGVIDQCGSPANRTITILSYLHIALQPLFISAFCMAIAPAPVPAQIRRWVFGFATIAVWIMLLRLVPLQWAGPCQPGDMLCSVRWCLVSGEWHLGWQVPMNDLWGSTFVVGSLKFQFPAYLVTAFVLPLFYGCWRFVLFHLVLGPILSQNLTDSPYESPAIWCLFSVGLLAIGASPTFRSKVFLSQRQAET